MARPEPAERVSQAERLQRIQSILDECLRRRAAGETLPDDAVIADHPDLLPELRERLTAVRLIENAGRRAADGPADLPPMATREADTTDLSDLTEDATIAHVGASLLDALGRRMVAEPGEEPTDLARYEILEPLGKGGMGIVVKARDRRLGRIVALKRIGRHLSGSGRELERFLAEARAIAALNHYNIVQIYDVDQDADGYFISMEYVEGEDLRTKIVRDGKLDPERAVEIARQVCNALSYAHERGIIHRDIKPGNILISARGTPKLVDFGLARIAEGQDLTQTGAIMGTTSYASPEQLRDSKNVDHRTDIYSLGATLYEMLTGLSPRVIQDSKLPEALRACVLKAVEHDRARRYPAAEALAEALAEAKVGDADHLVRRADQCYRDGDLEGALERYERVIRIDPDHIHARERVGLIQSKIAGIRRDRRQANDAAAQGQWETAVAAWQRVLQSAPGDTEARQQLAKAEAEIRNAKLAAALDHARRGLNGGDLKAADEQCQVALELDPSNQEAATIRRAVRVERVHAARDRLRTGLRAFQDKDYPVAIGLLREALDLIPEDHAERAKVVQSLDLAETLGAIAQADRAIAQGEMPAAAQLLDEAQGKAGKYQNLLDRIQKRRAKIAQKQAVVQARARRGQLYRRAGLAGGVTLIVAIVAAAAMSWRPAKPTTPPAAPPSQNPATAPASAPATAPVAPSRERPPAVPVPQPTPTAPPARSMPPPATGPEQVEPVEPTSLPPPAKPDGTKVRGDEAKATPPGLRRFVAQRAKGRGNGADWTNAHTDLQAALAAARPGEEIWVAAGTYKPAGPSGDRSATFQLKSGVSVYGGFAGREKRRDERDPNKNVTILSGDLNSDDVQSFAKNRDNSYHVVTGTEADATAVLDGFTITAGNANGSDPNDNGGDNDGAGLFIRNGNPTLANCVFRSNLARDYGGGVYARRSGDFTLTNCMFIGNRAGGGGGCATAKGSRTTLVNCTFTGNAATNMEGDMGGGGLRDAVGDLVLVNCTFSGNSSAERGGGLSLRWSGLGQLINCTFAGNMAAEGRAVACTALARRGQSQPVKPPHLVLVNCILWDGGTEIGARGSAATATCSDIQGGWDGKGNLSADPLFVEPDGPDNKTGTADDNLRLRAGSPCIDKGNSGAVPPDSADLDLDGKPRVSGNAVDMGAYEVQAGAAGSGRIAPDAAKKAAAGSPSARAANDFQPLFNGKDLTGWTYPPGSWAVEDGVLTRKGGGDIWTQQTYDDFVLELECKFAAGGNSGVFLRTANITDPAQTGMELQLADDFGKPADKRGSGAIYDCITPRKNAIKESGEWNRVRVTCRGSKIEIVLNGQSVVDMNLDQWTVTGKNPDGSPNKFKTAYKDMPRAGHIGLQDWGTSVWFRNIRLRLLNAAASPGGTAPPGDSRAAAESPK